MELGELSEPRVKRARASRSRGPRYSLTITYSAFTRPAGTSYPYHLIILWRTKFFLVSVWMN